MGGLIYGLTNLIASACCQHKDWFVWAMVLQYESNASCGEEVLFSPVTYRPSGACCRQQEGPHERMHSAISLAWQEALLCQ
mmetsp:Transcript_6670/g.23549  ORF Transcript_6670/g.23549 Transcript_6670/m.23549 type:complete len:81 (+) Transcript_6670:327-569(+)